MESHGILMIRTFLIGILTGFSLSIPIGPINLTVINEAFRKGFMRAFLIGFGGVLADTFYCIIAFLGFSNILEGIKSSWQAIQFVGGVIVFLLGVRYVYAQEDDLAKLKESKEAEIGKLFQKSIPIGFFMGISNVSLFILWGGVNTLFISHGWLNPELPHLFMIVLGIFLGSTSWFFLVSVFVSQLHKQINPHTLNIIARTCGLLLVVFGIILCFRSLTGSSGHFF